MVFLLLGFVKLGWEIDRQIQSKYISRPYFFNGYLFLEIILLIDLFLIVKKIWSTYVFSYSLIKEWKKKNPN